MGMITQVAGAMRTVLTTVASHAGRASGFVKRASKIGGAELTQTLVFGFQANPQATLEELAQAAATIGVAVTPQGLDQRFTKEAADCLRQVLEATVAQVITADPVVIPLLQRFAGGVYVQDSTTISLPASLRALWPGCGGSGDEAGAAALKVQVQWNYLTGALSVVSLHAGRESDRAAPVQTTPLPKGALRLADLGYFSLKVLAAYSEQGVLWLSRLLTNTAVNWRDGARLDLVSFLSQSTATQLNLEIRLGATAQLPARLIAVRLPQEVADRRRARLHQQASDKGKTVSQTALALADWTVLVTNLSVEQLSVREALVLARARWQIELLFKLWKSHAQVDETRSTKPWRILCEVYAKLLAIIIQHWLLLLGCWHAPDRSLPKAARTLQHLAWHLAATFASGSLVLLEAALTTIQRCLRAAGRVNKRRAAPASFQLLLDPELLPFA
jgi:hypothetical protein